MNRILAIALAIPVGATAQAASITTLQAADIHGGDSSTASFSDGNLTLTPFIGGTPATFNDNATRLGIDDQGTNVAAFNDPDTDPANGNEETLVLQFGPAAGLSQFVYDFSRADGPGPNDGVFISGFTADPQVTFTLGGAPLTSTLLPTSSYDAGTGTVELDIPGGLFNNNDIEVNFTVPNASRGQTLTMVTTDTTQAGAQLAIISISYQIPEPASAALALLAVAATARRRT